MTDDADLIERTKRALENVSDCPWLPDLTGDLVKMGWRTLHQETGISPSNYGTSRVVAKSVHAPRNIVDNLSTSWAIEILNEKLSDNYKSAGIEFYTAKEISDANLISCLEDAISLIKQVPTLHATVAALVRSIHLIKPKNDDYDVSFSEPHIPFSIFVSVPQQQSSTAAMRIAEAIVHEAMHLQLTLIEWILPLVNPISKTHYSPWRKEFRNAQGVFHGLYVFCVIHEFLGSFRSRAVRETSIIGYINARRSKIHNQVSQLRSFHDSEELAEIGAALLRQMITSLKSS